MNPVIDNSAQRRFEMRVEGRLAYLTYEPDGELLSLNHTEVPAELGGRGIGTALVRGALELLAARGTKIIPRCSFVVRFIQKYPQYERLVADA